MDSATSPTLLGRLRQQPADEAAWQEFVGRYGPRILRWCRQWQLQDADAQDVTQIVLTRLAQRMQSFVYDPSRSFRGWLRTLAQHAWSDFVAAGQRGGRGSGDSQTLECLHGLAARDDLVARLEEEFDHEILAEATARVQLRVEPDSWEAFRLITLEGLSGNEAAHRLGKEVAAVFKARSRVQALLRDEIRKMEGDDP
jgi:RNA polymerase sigma-70 factor (ECF subfamily)